MERFVIVVNGFQPLTIITKCSILNVAAVLDPPLIIMSHYFKVFFRAHCNIIRTSWDTEEQKLICRKNGPRKILNWWHNFFWLHPLPPVSLSVAFFVNSPPSLPEWRTFWMTPWCIGLYIIILYPKFAFSLKWLSFCLLWDLHCTKNEVFH